MKHHLHTIVLVLGTALLLLPSVGYAQVVGINFEVSPSISTTQIEPLVLEQVPDFETGTMVVAGTYIMEIAAHENMSVLATVSHDKALVNEGGHQLPLSAWLNYSNNGQNQQPQALPRQRVVFMLGATPLLVQNMEPVPRPLKAYLYINARTGALPQFANTTYVASIYVNIEYN